MTSSVGEVLDRSPAPGDLDAADDSGALIAPTLARAIVAVAFSCFGIVALTWVFEEDKNAGQTVLAIALLGGLLAQQYFYFCRPSTDLRSRTSYVMLGIQACVVYLPLAVYGQGWVSQPSFLAGTVLLVLPLPAAWPVWAGIVASTGVSQFYVTGAWLDVVYIMLNTATAGLYVYGLTRLARLVTALHEARGELAKTAVAHERLRFARDLHDLLGLSLSAIAPKGELALRLVRRNPGRAERELSEILEISRRALADVRAIARLYREISLNEETTTLATMLAASNVELRVDLDLHELPPHTRTALSAVLRESVAYVLRHRDVEHCEIILREHDGAVSVDIVNQGAGEDDDAAPSGFDNLSETVSRMAGELSVGVDPDGRLRLHVTLPVTARLPERPEEAADEQAKSMPHVATKLAGSLVVVVFCGLFVQAAIRVYWVTGAFWDIALVTAYLLAALLLQLGYFSRPNTGLRPPTSHLLLALLALLVFLPWAHLEVGWTGLVGFLAGSALLVLRPVLGWIVFLAVVAAVAWVHIALVDFSPRAISQITVATNLGLITYGLTWMARTVRQLRAARREQAEVALAETRLRFARDLHDLLGLSLSAITLKSELAYRLILLDPDRARTELTEVLEISRHALADVRSVASGYHEMSLEEECRTAESLLTTAGLDVRMDIDYRDLPPEVSTVVATVLREGVTNVLRHSKGESCEITISSGAGDVRLRVVNDGVTKPSDRSKNGWGSGIRNMSDRVAALGGVLTTQYESNGLFALCATVPIP